MSNNTVRIMLDIWAGPIWGCTYDQETKKYNYHMQKLADNKQLMAIHQEIQDLYSSYYHFDHNDQPVYFDEKQEKQDKTKMLLLFQQLLSIINKLDEGTYTIDDRETERIKNL
ncbi:RNA helicase [Aerococcaceae bacterium DSM 111176]|nr:RNA helicase [Aerococcaceae bacterium DSM 111176]